MPLSADGCRDSESRDDFRESAELDLDSMVPSHAAEPRRSLLPPAEEAEAIDVLRPLPPPQLPPLPPPPPQLLAPDGCCVSVGAATTQRRG